MEARELIENWRIKNKKRQGEMAVLLGLNSQQNYNDIKSGRTKKITVEIASRFKDLSGINVLDLQEDITTVSRENPYRIKYEKLMEEHMDCLRKINSLQSLKASNEREGLNEEEYEMLDIFSSLDSKDRKILSEFLSDLKAKQKGSSAKKNK